MKKLFLSFLLLSISFPSLAMFYDGNDLSDWNRSRKKALNETANSLDFLNAGMFRGFVISTFNSFEDVSICTESNATLGQIEDVVGLYIDNHPELRTKSATDLTFTALSQAFPCKK